MSKKLIFLCLLANFAYCFPSNKAAHTTTGRPCSNVKDQARVMQCTPLMMEFANKTSAVMDKETKVNDTGVLELIDLCHQIRECSKDNCYFPESMQSNMKLACSGIKLKNTEFFVCLTTMKTVKPTKKTYPCLAGVASPDEMFSTHKECAKTVMKDVCGPKAVYNFDKRIGIMNDLAKIAMDADYDQ